jgi:ABC-2 type transport system permease protein
MAQQLGLDPISGRVFANEPVVMNMVAYLTDQNGLITARNKEVTIRPLDKEKIKNEKTFWQMINIGFPLIIIVLFGVALSWMRKRTYANF